MAKILVILSGGISSDGISSAWYSLSKELKNSGLNVGQIDFLEIQEESDENGVGKLKNLGYNIITTPLRKSAPLAYFRDLRRIIRKGKYDVVHVNGSSALMLLEMLASKIEGVNLRVAHSRNTTCDNKLLHKLLSLPFNLLTNVKLACGKDAGRWLFGGSDFQIFHNGIDLKRFQFNCDNRRKAREILGLDDKTLAIGHVGKFNYQKNHEFLIEIFSEVHKIHPDSRLFLFGDGDLENDIREKVDRLGLRDYVKFMGVVTNIEFYISGMDEMLLPSRFEGLPNVVVEWQASGLSSVVSDSVTNECKVTDLVEFLSLEEAPQTWAEHVVDNFFRLSDREASSEQALQSLKAQGFDIRSQSILLQKIYNQTLS